MTRLAPICGSLLSLAIGIAIGNLMPCSAQGQSQQKLEFEVASIRPAVFPSDAYASGFRAGAATNPCAGRSLSIAGTRVVLTLAGICEIIRIAYDVKSYQVIGVPATLGFSGQDKIAQASPAASLAESGKQPVYFYDIDARAPGTSPPSEGQAREMLRALLADRFHLTLHRDRSALSYYALTAVNGAAKLKPAAEGCKPQRNPELLDACGQTMEQLARFLIAHADRPVVDMTGISGKFDYEIPISRAEPIDFRALAASLQEHLKLKLEARNGPIEILVVDHVERPSTN